MCCESRRGKELDSNQQDIAANHDKSNFINFDQDFEPRNHFVELVDGSQANSIVMVTPALIYTIAKYTCIDVS